ncbi:MAG: DUF885 domain-containing protein [Xanthomonadales bacterium]|jgi:uncharacterized protein (DUF885 family)|nr:DUF885 domain-containing protein [Xanthomonadales bacterium]
MRAVFVITCLIVSISAQTAFSDTASNRSVLRQVSGDYVQSHRGGEGRASRNDWSAATFLDEIRAKKKQLALLESINPGGFTLEEDIDRRLLIGLLRTDIRMANTLRRWENDPRIYLPGARLGDLLEGGNAARQDQLNALLAALPGRLAQGRANLKRPPERFTEAAIFQGRNSLESMETALEKMPKDGRENAARARDALAGWLAFLENDLLPRSDGSWMLGRETYDFVLRERWHMEDDADSIYRRGMRAFEETEAQAVTVASRMQPGKHWTEVYETLKDDHPPANGLKQAYQEQMDRAQEFVRQHGILTLPEGERVITLDTPPAMRRSSPFGTFEMVDPFDDGLEGRLFLTPVEDWMTAEQKAQRLRSHHNAWIPVIAVHEAYPGHHAHGIKLKENPNLLRRVVSESIFTEGWGLFTEELMFEQGFLQGDAVRLTVLRNRLWRAARVILDSGLHTGKMTFDEAVAFLVDRVRFDAYAAELEVGMYIREPTYVLGYLIGMQEMETIRAEYIARHGEPDPPSRLYDRLLEIGAIPPALAREALFATDTP